MVAFMVILEAVERSAGVTYRANRESNAPQSERVDETSVRPQLLRQRSYAVRLDTVARHDPPVRLAVPTCRRRSRRGLRERILESQGAGVRVAVLEIRQRVALEERRVCCSPFCCRWSCHLVVVARRLYGKTEIREESRRKGEGEKFRVFLRLQRLQPVLPPLQAFA